MTTSAVTAGTQGLGSKGVRREKRPGVRLKDRINDAFERMMEVAKTQRCQEADVVWTERAIVVLLASSVGMAATGIGMIPLIAVASLLGICVIAYAIIRKKIHAEITSEYEPLRKQLLALEEAIWGKVPNPDRAAKILEGIVLNRGLEFQHLGRIDIPTVENLERIMPRSRMPRFCRALISDIVRGSKVNDPVIGKNTIYDIGASSPTKDWDPDENLNKLARENPRLLKKHPKLYKQYLERLFEEAMEKKDPRLLDGLPYLQEECKKQLSGVKKALCQDDLLKAK